jgi:hypothetical protein
LTEAFTPSETQKAAAKPWTIGIFVSMGLGLLSLVLLAVYQSLAVETNYWIWGLWFCGTAIAVDLGIHFCNTKLARLIGDDLPRLNRRWLSWTLFAAFGLLILFLK